MDVIKINNGSSGGHFDVVNVVEETPSVIANGTTKSGKYENQQSMESVEGERASRKRKTRRFKSRYKGKCMSKSKYEFTKKMRTRVYPQSEAPNNTNQFLMAEHTIEDLDDSLSKEKSRHRESSFTSVDTEDDDQFYSSPEDEDEFLTKDFDNTYRSVYAEKFANLSKAQLTKYILDLEAKVDELNKRLVSNTKLDEMSMLMQMNGLESKEINIQVKEVLLENERLKRENEELRQRIKCRSRDRSESESSSSSSGDTGSDESSDSEDAKNTEENEAADKRTTTC
jgi:protein HEXIM1/2